MKQICWTSFCTSQTAAPVKGVYALFCLLVDYFMPRVKGSYSGSFSACPHPPNVGHNMSFI